MPNKPWQFLKPGDIVDIIAPSSMIPTDDLHAYYLNVKHTLETIGLIARIPDDLIVLEKDPFSANEVEYRVQHAINSFRSEDSKAIWPIRGGYGSAKLIPFLEKIDVPQKPKLLLGFSDITALHLFLNNKWHWNSLHSAGVSSLISNVKFLEELRPIIFGEQEVISYNQLFPLNNQARQKQEIKTEITGGNLSLIQTSLATSWQINATDKIVFIEEVDERGYRVDRILNHLLQAGVFKNAKAVIFGQVIPGFEKNGANLCEVAIENFAKTLDIPVLFLPIIGHNATLNAPLPLGSICNLSLGGKSYLSCLSGGIQTYFEDNIC